MALKLAGILAHNGFRLAKMLPVPNYKFLFSFPPLLYPPLFFPSPFSLLLMSKPNYPSERPLYYLTGFGASLTAKSKQKYNDYISNTPSQIPANYT